AGMCPAEPDGGAAAEGLGGAGARSSATVGEVSGSLGFAFGSGTRSAPASPMRAMGAPILAGTPWSTRICRTPSASASRSNVALSDSTSARTSPVFTSSPLFFFHSTMVPSSIVSESFGIFMSVIYLSPEGEQRRLPGRRPGRLCRRRDERKPSGFPLISLISAIRVLSERVADQALDVLAGRDRDPLELLVVGHRHLRPSEPADGRVQVIETTLLHARRDLRGHAIGRPAFLDDDAAARLAHRIDDGLPVDGSDRAQVDDLGVDVFLLELLGGLVGEHGHPGDTNDGHVGAIAAQRRLAQRRGVIAGRD